MSTELLDREAVEKRKNELEPLVEEFQRIERVLGVWEGSSGSAPAPARSRRTTNAKRAGRGSRKTEFLALVESNPGITVAQASEKMPGVNPNYLYRLAADLVKDHKVVKQGKGYHPTTAGSPQSEDREEEAVAA